MFGKGSTFKFNIEAKGFKLNGQQITLNNKFMGKRILIVDDNELNRILLTTTIFKWGQQLLPVCCSSGEEALQYLDKMKFDDIYFNTPRNIYFNVKSPDLIINSDQFNFIKGYNFA